MTSGQLIPTLSGLEYSSAEVYDRERSQIFHRSWFYVCREDRLAPGARFIADVAGDCTWRIDGVGDRLHAPHGALVGSAEELLGYPGQHGLSGGT